MNFTVLLLSENKTGGFNQIFSDLLKGQLISKCPYEKSVLSKIPMKKIPRFLP